jgi:hypothetical protein
MRRLVRAAVLLWALASVARALPGRIAGSAKDETGGALPGVTVEVLGPALPEAKAAVTDRAGAYAFEGLAAGSYRVSFRLLNFVGVAREGVAVLDGRTTAVDAVLHLSASADVVVTGKRTFRNLADVTEPGESLIGIAEAANQGAVTAEQIENRPSQRPGDILESIPGVAISQHSGEGKANQYYLRGFNLDHGTDFATAVAGMPVNMPTHAHGQGYTDLNFLIPELVSGVQYKKGPYFVEDGDFTSAGSANINYVNMLDGTIGQAGGGSNSYGRALFATAPKVGEGRLLAAVELVHNNGPWVHPDNLQKYNGVLRFSAGDEQNGFSVTAMGYHAKWNATDQVPDRALSEGLIPRYGSLDPSDGGETHRYSLSAEYQRSGEASLTHAAVYAIDYKLDLFSNFTYFLDDPVSGDQFEQYDRRQVYGAKVTHRWFDRWAAFEVENEVGFQGRFDDIGESGLFHTQDRVRLSTRLDDRVTQWSGAVFFQTETQWTSKVKSVLGLRGDLYHFDVAASDPLNSGQTTKGILSPKLSLVFGPFGQVELYANAGYGFHSNDGRGALTRRDPNTGDLVDPVTPLVRAKAAEVGARAFLLPGWQTTVALWGLDLASELVFLGDAGTTEPSRPSRRYGVEWSNFYRILPWLMADADLSISKARFTNADPAGDHIPGSIQDVVSAGITVDSMAGFSGSLRMRYFGPRPLIEDDSVRSKAATTLNALVSYTVVRGVRLSLEVLNLTNAKVSDIDYYYASRLPGEPPGGVNDIHTHPAEPRLVRAFVSVGF